MPVFRPRAAVAIAVLFGLAAVGCSSSQPPKPSRPTALKPENERRTAPDFALKDANGRTVHLSDYKGKVVLLDFWATWCGPCKLEIPWFMEFQRQHKDKGFEVVGISMDEDGWDSVKPFISEMAINYRILIGSDTTAQAYGGVDALPTTFLIDREGKIAAVHVGLASKRDFEDGIEELLQAPAGGSDRASLAGFPLRAR